MHTHGWMVHSIWIWLIPFVLMFLGCIFMRLIFRRAYHRRMRPWMRSGDRWFGCCGVRDDVERTNKEQ